VAYFIFEVPGEPRGKGRPRFFRRGKGVGTYTDDKTVSYENLVRTSFKAAYPDCIPTRKAVTITIHAYFSIPKSASKVKREAMLERNIRPTKKPDVKNILAAVEDGLNTVAYMDDSQIIYEKCGKYYDEKPRVIVVLREFRDEN